LARPVWDATHGMSVTRVGHDSFSRASAWQVRWQALRSMIDSATYG
jgi:hypothetical protein